MEILILALLTLPAVILALLTLPAVILAVRVGGGVARMDHASYVERCKIEDLKGAYVTLVLQSPTLTPGQKIIYEKAIRSVDTMAELDYLKKEIPNGTK